MWSIDWDWPFFIFLSQYVLAGLLLPLWKWTLSLLKIPSLRCWNSSTVVKVWFDFDRASSLICGNKMPSRCNRGFYCRSYCLLNMFRAPLCPSSGDQECFLLATIYLQLIQNRYMFRSFTLLQCSHQHCVQPVASDVEVVGYI